MADKVGEIYADVDIETGGLLDSVKVVDKATKSVGKNFNKVEAAADEAGHSVSLSTGKMSQSVSAFSGNFQKNVPKIKKSAVEVQKAMAESSRKLGQAGIQLEQFVGQVGSGTNFLRALGYQATDLGYVLNVPLLGAVIGISSAIGAVLIPNLLKGADATGDLDNAMTLLEKTASTSNGVTAFTDNIKALAEESEKAARLVLLSAEQSAKDAGKAAGMGISEAFNDTFDVTMFQKSFDALKSIAGTTGSFGYSTSKDLEGLGIALGATGDKARQVGTDVLVSMRQMEQAMAAGTDDAGDKIIKFQELLLSLAESAQGDARRKILSFASSINDYVQKASEAAKVSQKLKEALNDVDFNIDTADDIKKLEETKSKIDSIADSLIAQRKALDGDTEATLRNSVAKSLNLKAGEKIPTQIEDEIKALVKRKKELKEQAEIEKSEARETQVLDRLDQQIAKLSLTNDEYDEYLLKKQLELDSEGQLTTKVQERLDKLRELGVVQNTFAAGFNEQLKEVTKTAENLDATIGRAFGSTLTSGIDAASDGLTDLILKGGSFEDTVKDIARAVITDLVRSLVKIGVQMAVNYALGETFKAASTATGVAQAATLATAYATPAALASTATAGGAAVAGTSAVLAGISAVNAASIGTGRLYGGSVSSDKIYPVTENGKPEMLVSGNKSYLLGAQGKVVSNKDMTSGGSGGTNIEINVKNYGSQKVDVSSRQEGSGLTAKEVIDIVVGDTLNRGRTHQAITGSTTATNRTE